MIKVAVGYESLGPYHLARLGALAPLVELLTVEFSRISATYEWQPAEAGTLPRVTLAYDENGPVRESLGRLEAALTNFKPDVVFAPGWASWQSLAMLKWGLKASVPVVVMSDSQEIDEVRLFYKEFVKAQLLRLFDGAFVAGKRHVDYLTKLGFENPIKTGYDVIDNDHFAPNKIMQLQRNEFLCCARLVEKKNIRMLIQAYRLFLTALGPEASSAPRLVIAGDGVLRDALQGLIEQLGLNEKAVILGFVPYANLPTIFHRALVFILPSSTEQWGLVVNEAMAAGCPVFVSDRSGCAPDLVRDGENGYIIDPDSPEALADRLMWAHRNPKALKAMGERSIKLVSRLTLDTHANAMVDLASTLKQRRYSGKPLLGRLVLDAMLVKAGAA